MSGCLIGVIAVIPYTLEISRETLQKIALPLPLSVVLVLQVIQNAMIFGVAVGVGLLVSRKTGLGAPVLEAWVYKRENIFKPAMFTGPAIAGLILGVLTFALANFIFLPFIPQLRNAAEMAIPLWKRFFACFYGGFNEEILMRLFLFSLALWMIGKLRRSSQTASLGVLWTSNVVVSLIFGFGHIPAAAQVMPINAMTMIYLLSLNGAASLLFGYLFWSRGLEAAMVAHFSADVVVQVIGPGLLG